MARSWTPRELLERGELEIGERVMVDGPPEVEIQRVGGSKLLSPNSGWVWGLYYAVHRWPDRLTTHYLHTDATWHLSTQDVDIPRDDGPGDGERIRYPGFFDSLPELLDALYLAILKDEEVAAHADATA